MVEQKTWISFIISFVILALVAVAYHRCDDHSRTRGRQWKPHAVCWGVCAIVLAVSIGLGDNQDVTEGFCYVFNDLTVTLMGTVFPIYESVRAICTPEEDDDQAWLQYWMVGGMVFVGSQFVDEYLSETGALYWFEAMFFFYLWLFFPKTDGAALVYDKFTKPFLAPIVRPVQNSMHGCFSYIYQSSVNIIHLVIVYVIFVFLPGSWKQIVAVAIGTVYPWISSILAAGTEEVDDDTYWLTYWSCYGCLFLLMEILESWLGWIPGFYTVIIAATVYLMLPMFHGADKVFRKVLVPLAGLQELLLLRDAIQVKKRMLKDLDPERATAVRRAIAKFYSDEGNSSDPADLKKELMSGWRNVKILPGVRSLMRNPFAKKTNATTTASGAGTTLTPVDDDVKVDPSGLLDQDKV